MSKFTIPLQVIRGGLTAAAAKSVKTISIPMVGAGMRKNNPIEMTRAIVRACGDFARNQVSSLNKIYFIFLFNNTVQYCTGINDTSTVQVPKHTVYLFNLF